jgi:microsomal dipeptidase-like Zn-dependent dipeptidase
MHTLIYRGMPWDGIVTSSSPWPKSARQKRACREKAGATTPSHFLDLTHLADESFWQALEQFNGPVLASHKNCRAIAPGDRQYSDEQIRAIIERDGVIGAPFDAWMMVPGWTADRAKSPQVTLDSAVNHIDHICQLAGNTHHVAIGSDLDGGFGSSRLPKIWTPLPICKASSHCYENADIARLTLKQSFRRRRCSPRV